MAGVKVTVTDMTKQFESSTDVKANIFLRMFADKVVSTAEPNTPKDTQDLRNRIVKSVLGLKGKIKWNAEYASIQEEKQFSNYTTPGTGPNFAKNAVRDTVKSASKIMKDVGLI